MKNCLRPGIAHELSFVIPASKTVPHLYPEFDEYQLMPQVFATGFLVGLIEGACIQAINPHIDWPNEQTVGTHVNLSHEAATPPGLTVIAKVRLTKVDGRRLYFEVEAHDSVDVICKGTHERFVIDVVRFNQKVQNKLNSCQGSLWRIT